jgi:predicted XRE-type DNA-binding protein
MPAVQHDATIRSLRSDIALQVSRFAQRSGLTQMAMARKLGVPQPTISKIVNGRVSDLSIELLIRVAVRAGLSITLHTGHAPEEAGAFICSSSRNAPHRTDSRLADEARESALQSGRRLSPSGRLEAFLEHNVLLSALNEAGRGAARKRMNKARRVL